MKNHLWMGVISLLLLPGLTSADPWKDESGHGRGGPPPWAGRGGEPPDWARGKGVWDGHFQHNRPPLPRTQYFGDRAGRPRMHYAPPVPYGRAWEDHRDWEKDRWEDHRERWKERREHDREAWREWREWQREDDRYDSPPRRPAPPQWQWH